jgi:formate hydrogenlyase subunit 4
MTSFFAWLVVLMVASSLYGINREAIADWRRRRKEDQ